MKKPRRLLRAVTDWAPWIAAWLALVVLVSSLSMLYDGGNVVIVLAALFGALVFAAALVLVSDKGERIGVGDYPIPQVFPNIGPQGEITVDCMVWPSSRPLDDYPPVDENGNARAPGVTPHCVGAFHVEVDQYGLRFKWKPAKVSDEPITSPFRFPFSAYPSTAGSPKREQRHTDDRPDDGPREPRPLNVGKE